MTITAEDLVRREVHYCVSHLVSTLANGCYAVDWPSPAKAGVHDLRETCEQAQVLAAPVDDWKEAAEQAGWSRRADGLFVHDEWKVLINGRPEPDPRGYADWQALCWDKDIEPYQWEVFEHWIVSDWLADKLEAHGEKVDRDFAGLTVWARTATGQAIAMDSVIERIRAELTATT